MPNKGRRKVEFSIQEMLDGAHRFFDQRQWDIEVGGLSTVRALGIKVTRVLSLAWSGLVQNDCLTRASALTYITVLSLVPLLAFVFAMAKGFGAYEILVETTITPFLDQMAPPPAPGVAATAGGAQEIRTVVEGLLDFAGNTNFTNLGLIGLVMVIVAAIRLMTTIEGVFNLIWGLKQARPIMRKVTDFVALLVITPILMLVATTVTVSLQSNAVTEFLTTELGLGLGVQLLSRLVPLVMVWLSFALLYMIMPNTRVPFAAALLGGVVGGTIWQIVQVLHIEFQIGVANYNAIYAGFAAFPLFLVWVYMNWVGVLLGALVAWAYQSEPAYRERRRVQATSPRDREVVALRGLVHIATAFSEGKGATETRDVAAHCGVPPGVLQGAFKELVEAGLLAHTDDGEAQGFLPARPLREIRINSILQALRGTRHQPADETDTVSELIDRLESIVESSPDNLTIEELVARPAS